MSLVDVKDRGRAGDYRKLDYRILGSFEVCIGGRMVSLGGDKPRAVFVIVLIDTSGAGPSEFLVSSWLCSFWVP